MVAPASTRAESAAPSPSPHPSSTRPQLSRIALTGTAVSAEIWEGDGGYRRTMKPCALDDQGKPETGNTMDTPAP